MKRIIRFTASWCGPCKSLASNLEVANLELPIEVVDIDIHDNVAVDYNIRSVPTLVLLDDGHEIGRIVGPTTLTSASQTRARRIARAGLEGFRRAGQTRPATSAAI